MAPGSGNFDLVGVLRSNVIHFIKKRQAICSGPCDGLILKMHYQWTFWFLLATCYAVSYSWFPMSRGHNHITCVSHFDASHAIREDYVNLCLSYPFVENGGSRRYILFYRWIPYFFILFAAVYYLARKLSKGVENDKIKKLFEDLSVHQLGTPEDQLVHRAALYVSGHWNTHNGIYFKYLVCNMVALLIDVVFFFSLDFLLQGRFKTYGFSTLPFKRDVETFKDYMSQTFPPFVQCEIGPSYKLTNKRTETLGCHLLDMELYEKVFFVLWCWLIGLMFFTCLYIVYLLSMSFPFVRHSLLKVPKPKIAELSIKVALSKLLNNCKIGDFYMLYRLKEFFSPARYYELLHKLANANFANPLLQGISIDSIEEIESKSSLRQRYRGPPKRHHHGGNLHSQSLPNSSILVE